MLIQVIQGEKIFKKKKRKRNPNITLKIVIKSQDNRIKEQKNTQMTPINKMAIKTHASVVTLNEPNAARYTVAE